MPADDWMARAACHDLPVDFVTEDEDQVFPMKTRRARAICAGCPVDAECRAYAYRNDYSLAPHATRDYGVFGGTTGHQRRLVVDRPDRLELLADWWNRWLAGYRPTEDDVLPQVALPGVA